MGKLKDPDASWPNIRGNIACTNKHATLEIQFGSSRTYPTQHSIFTATLLKKNTVKLSTENSLEWVFFCLNFGVYAKSID